MTPIAWIRSHYDVPAKRGARVTFEGRPGRILSSVNGHLRIQLDDGKKIITHPLWHVDYLDGRGER